MRKANTRRADKLSDAIMQELGRILIEETQDPRLELVSISGVRLNRDMSVAQVLYTHGGGQERREEVEQALHSARGYLRTLLGQRLKLRYVPELRFAWDTFLEKMVYDLQPDPDSQGY